jgi:hypothetical protein
MKWTIWLNIVSPHLAPVVRGLASMPDQKVTVVADGEPLAHRKAIGWGTPDCGAARVLIKPTDGQIEELIEANRGSQSVHLLNGVAKIPLSRRVLPRLAATGAQIGLISEGADPRGILGLGRRVKYRLARYSRGGKFSFILAMGQLGAKWFRSAGYDSFRIFDGKMASRQSVRWLACRLATGD